MPRMALYKDRNWMPPVFTLLKQQRSEIDEVMETIYANVAKQRADLQICLPELRRAVLGLTEDHFIDAKILAKELGEDHALVREIEHEGDQLVDAVNTTLRFPH